MNCPNCGLLNNGGAYCNNCGKPLISNNNISQNEVPGEMQNIQSQMQINNNPSGILTVNSNQQPFSESFEINDNELLNAYICTNVNELRNGSFSWCTFFFGAIYMFYRKMWILGILYMALNCIPIVGLISWIYFSVIFKKEYVKNAVSKIEQIKFDNPRSTQQELKYLCSKKGGTTIWPIIVFGILPLLVLAVAIPTIIILLTFKGNVPQIDKARNNAIILQAETYIDAADRWYEGFYSPDGYVDIKCISISTINNDYSLNSSSFYGYVEVNPSMDKETYKIYMTDGEKGIYGKTITELRSISVVDIDDIEIPSYCR